MNVGGSKRQAKRKKANMNQEQNKFGNFFFFYIFLIYFFLNVFLLNQPKPTKWSKFNLINFAMQYKIKQQQQQPLNRFSCSGSIFKSDKEEVRTNCRLVFSILIGPINIKLYRLFNIIQYFFSLYFSNLNSLFSFFFQFLECFVL